jgi:phosphoribosylaminoimidazolecarboxamide formyltransferase/IMP cyclohydrolase
MKTALISVYNKEGIVEFAKELQDLGFRILASGGTAKVLSSAGIEAIDIASMVGKPILDHRVVTLSREIYAGLLARDVKEDRAELDRLSIPWIDLVCVDLYPLEKEIAKWNQETLTHPTGTLSQGEREKMVAAKAAVVEKTDIGGPTLLRAAAKGRRIVICDSADRLKVVEWLKNGEPEKQKFINKLCAKAEFVVANYCLNSARYHSIGIYDGICGEEISACKYGENAWQTPAGLFKTKDADLLSLSKFQLIAGTGPSYNNWCDIDRLLQTITHIAAGFDVNFSKTSFIAVGVKHGNPCGAAVSDNPAEAIKKMLEGDLRAIFGGIVMLNFAIDKKLAGILLNHRMENDQRRLLDAIVAPAFSPEAILLLRRKGDKCRFLTNPALESLSKESLDRHFRFRYVRGGFLRQPNYTFILDLKSNEIIKIGDLSSNQEKDLLLAWAMGSTSNSNTTTLVKNQMLIGNGVGQQDRVGGCELAVKRSKDAGHNSQEAVAYSDSFFPFIDGPKVLAEAGIKAIFSTRGSIKDKEIEKFCRENKIILIMLPDTQARGFFGH